MLGPTLSRMEHYGYSDLAIPQPSVWVSMLGPTLSRMEHYGYLDLAIPGPTDTALHGHSVIGLHFSADWCQPCSTFTPVLEKLYAAQRARGAQQLEVVLVS